MRLASAARSLCLASMALSAVACTKENPVCEGPCVDAKPIDAAPPTCTTPGPNIAECPAETPVCEMGACTICTSDAECDGRGATPVCAEETTGACVACDDNNRQSPAVGTADDHCPTAGMQVCDAASNTCRACRADSECTSGVCNELNGECANTVLHVDNRGGSNGNDANDCLSAAMPCLTVAGAMAKTVTGTRYIAVHASATQYAGTAEVLVNGTASVFLQGIPDPALPNERAILDRSSGNGPILRVSGSGASLVVTGVTLTGAAGSSDGDGVICQNDARLTLLDSILEANAHFGFSSTSCTLLIDRSIVRENNRGGGLVEGDFSITNSFILGNVGTNFGGLDIADLDPSDVFAHNTIYRNTANGTAAGGVRCSGTGTARHNIIYGSLGTSIEVLGCGHEYSLVGTVPAIAVALGTGNITAGTVDEIHFDNIATLPFDLHLTAGSIAFGKGGPNDGGGRTVRDIDGEMRPTNMADLGADEVP